MSRSIKLITGIPRSGTTLCCKLLNQRADVVALHEPINPGAMPQSYTAKEALDSIVVQIGQFDRAIEQGLPFTHADKGGLTTDNPVGLNVKNGVRQVVAKRGEVQLPAREENSYELFIKQNALFTALMPRLERHFPIMCIVRNPVDVLLSWLTVDLPVNRGHIPAGERFDPLLRQQLAQQEDCLSRQLTIYKWFMVGFLTSGHPIIRYEDVIASDGANLDKALGLSQITRETLQSQQRTFSPHILQQIDLAMPSLMELDFAGLYGKKDILQARSEL